MKMFAGLDDHTLKAYLAKSHTPSLDEVIPNAFEQLDGERTIVEKHTSLRDKIKYGAGIE